jgi:TetR/AcrR family transcriptional regulator, regulator of autoinduction and epiphytic fitness
MLDSADVTPLDGRIARSRRTRAAIVEALVTLLEEGNPQPTVEEIAARASVAPRTVFQHYADREALFAAVSEHREAHLQALMGQIDPAAPLADRIDAIVAQRARVFEWIAAVRRGALLMEPFSASVHEALESFRAAKRAELERVFATEIAARPEDQRAAFAAALGVAGSWSCWDALRSQQQLDSDAAAAALRLTLRSLLCACPS